MLHKGSHSFIDAHEKKVEIEGDFNISMKKTKLNSLVYIYIYIGAADGL